MENQTANQEQPKKGQVITASAVRELLQQGKTRKEIKAHFGLSHAGMQKLFSNPALKGKRTAAGTNAFEFVDDISGTETAPAPKAATATNAQAEVTENPTATEEGQGNYFGGADQGQSGYSGAI